MTKALDLYVTHVLDYPGGVPTITITYTPQEISSNLLSAVTRTATLGTPADPPNDKFETANAAKDYYLSGVMSTMLTTLNSLVSTETFVSGSRLDAPQPINDFILSVGSDIQEQINNKQGRHDVLDQMTEFDELSVDVMSLLGSEHKTEMKGVLSIGQGDVSGLSDALTGISSSVSSLTSSVSDMATTLDGKQDAIDPLPFIPDAPTDAPTDASESYNPVSAILGTNMNSTNAKQNDVAENTNSHGEIINSLKAGLISIGMMESE